MKNAYIVILSIVVSLMIISCEKEETDKTYYLEGDVIVSINDTINQIDTTLTTTNALVKISSFPEMNNVFEVLKPVQSGFFSTILEEGVYYIQVEATEEISVSPELTLKYNFKSKIDTLHITSNTLKDYTLTTKNDLVGGLSSGTRPRR